jgi:glycine/D-amino acid oxidase-like deaminating enzyme
MILFEWIVIGGGIHGCTVVSFLIKEGKVTNEQLRIIDPNNEPMYRWKKNTGIIGMDYLRSPGVHQIVVDPYSLQKFAWKHRSNRNELLGKYKRPSSAKLNAEIKGYFR